MSEKVQRPAGMGCILETETGGKSRILSTSWPMNMQRNVVHGSFLRQCLWLLALALSHTSVLAVGVVWWLQFGERGTLGARKDGID